MARIYLNNQSNGFQKRQSDADSPARNQVPAYVAMGLFENNRQAQNCLSELLESGFTYDEILVMRRDDNPQVMPAGVGNNRLDQHNDYDRLARRLSGLGAPESEARIYVEHISHGNVLIVAHPTTINGDQRQRTTRALEIMTEYNTAQIATEDETPLAKTTESGADSDPYTSGFVIPIIAEKLRVGRRLVETGRYRISKRVREDERIVQGLFRKDQLQVRRVKINRFVDEPPPIRYESGQMIIPVLEEILVVERRLKLKEELHIRKQEQVTELRQPITLRSEEVTVNRVVDEQAQSYAGDERQ